MLVLARRESGEIMIGGGVRIMVVEIRGDKVRLGIEAPRALPVHRREIAAEICRDHHDPSRPESDCWFCQHPAERAVAAS